MKECTIYYVDVIDVDKKGDIFGFWLSRKKADVSEWRRKIVRIPSFHKENEAGWGGRYEKVYETLLLLLCARNRDSLLSY